jgi:hypothetical protein
MFAQSHCIDGVHIIKLSNHDEQSWKYMAVLFTKVERSGENLRCMLVKNLRFLKLIFV